MNKSITFPVGVLLWFSLFVSGLDIKEDGKRPLLGTVADSVAHNCTTHSGIDVPNCILRLDHEGLAGC